MSKKIAKFCVSTAGEKYCQEGKKVQADWPFGHQLWAWEVPKTTDFL